MKKNETDLLHELFKSVEVLGVSETTKALKIARDSVLTFQDHRVDFVLKMVCGKYNLSVDEMIYTHTKSIKRVLALKFCTYYLYEHFEISYKDLESIMKRDKSLLSRQTKELKADFVTNNSMKEIKSKFDLLVKDFKFKNNL